MTSAQSVAAGRSYGAIQQAMPSASRSSRTVDTSLMSGDAYEMKPRKAVSAALAPGAELLTILDRGNCIIRVDNNTRRAKSASSPDPRIPAIDTAAERLYGYD